MLASFRSHDRNAYYTEDVHIHTAAEAHVDHTCNTTIHTLYHYIYMYIYTYMRARTHTCACYRNLHVTLPACKQGCKQRM